MSAQTTKMTTCVECGGNGQSRVEYEATRWTESGYVTEMSNTCPWCDGTGQVEVRYAVYGGGWNGDFSFHELYTVEDTLAKAKRYAERYMLSKDRRANALEDGTPTLQYMEVVGQADEMFAVEEKDGQLFWSEP